MTDRSQTRVVQNTAPVDTENASVEQNLAHGLPDKPEEPLESDCCGEGCTPCVFDIYDQDLKRWEEECYKIRIDAESTIGTSDTQGGVLRLSKYEEFPIKSITKESRNSFIFRFKLNRNETLGLQVGQHIFLRWKTGDKSLTRQYTPVSDRSARGYFDVLIKVYANGQMSQYVKTWEVGDRVEWRGPYGRFTYTPGMARRVVMLAAGTGLAPMAQVISAVLADDQDETRLRLLYCCQHHEDILLKSTLDSWADFWNFSVTYLLSQECGDGVCARRYGDDVRHQRLTEELLTSELGSDVLETLVLICGTKSFDKDMVNYLLRIGVSECNYFKF